MKRKIKRLFHIISKEGIYTFFYLLWSNLKVKMSDSWKYKHWQRRNEKPITKRLADQWQPFLSVVVTGAGKIDDKTMQSLKKQTYSKWELVDSVEKVRGEYLVFLRNKDILGQEALYRFALEQSQETQALLFYSDEDVIDEKGKRKKPYFKPEYSPDTLISHFYMGGLLVLKKELVEKLSYTKDKIRGFDGYLAAMESVFFLKDERVHHIPQVLYHKRENAENDWDLECLAKEKQDLFRFYGKKIHTEICQESNSVRVIYDVSKEEPLVSIIIPSKDNPSMLKQCLDSIEKHTRYTNYEIVVVDNGSNPENKKEYESLCNSRKLSCTYHYDPKEFNFSYMCNTGAGLAKGEYFLFLNDDIEVKGIVGEYDWLSRLVGQAMEERSGAVGAKLYYPNSNRIQHIGVVNYESGAAHCFSKKEDVGVFYGGINRIDYNCSIVTGACLLVSAKKFWDVGGFEEKLAVTFNDVELCFRLLKAGYYMVVRNDVILYHHESITRGADDQDPKKFLRHLKEREKLFAMHPQYVKRDAFYSPYLTQKELDYKINTQLLPKELPVFGPDKRTGDFIEDKDEFICNIEYANIDRYVEVRGFCFSEKVRYNNCNQVYVVLQGKEQTLYAKVKKMYNPTLAIQLEQDKNLNFIEFYSSFDSSKLKEEQYKVGILVKPMGREKGYLKFTNIDIKKR